MFKTVSSSVVFEHTKHFYYVVKCKSCKMPQSKREMGHGKSLSVVYFN